MIRIIFSVLCLVVFSVSAEASNDALIKKVETYFAKLESFQADIDQLNPDGSKAKGKFYLQRPEKFRLEYSAPKPQVISSNGSVTVEYDPQENIPNFISLSGTPAGLLLRKKVTLTGDTTVTNIIEKDNILQVNLVKTDDPQIGNMTLVFETKPMKLIYWVIQDAQGLLTEVALKNIKQNQPLKKDLFTFPG